MYPRFPWKIGERAEGQTGPANFTRLPKRLASGFTDSGKHLGSTRDVGIQGAFGLELVRAAADA